MEKIFKILLSFIIGLTLLLPTSIHAIDDENHIDNQLLLTKNASGIHDIFVAKDNSKLERFKARIFNRILYKDEVIDVSDIDISPYEIKYTFGNSSLTGIDAARSIVRNHALFSTAATTGFPEFTYKENRNVATVKFSYHSAWTEDFIKKVIEGYDEAMSLLKPNDSDFAKALKLHDWIVKNVSYGMSTLYYDFAVGALANKKAVCAGYAQCYQFLLSQAGVDSIYVAANTKKEPHAWNLVKIDGHYFHVDCTWDRGLGTNPNVHHTYFMVNDEEFNKDGAHGDDWKDPSKGYPTNNQCYIENKYYNDNTGIATDEQIASNPIKIKHVYDDSTSYNASSSEHWRTCVAGVEVHEQHNENPCSICHYEDTKTCNHVWEDKHNESQHWQECKNCKEIKNRENHTPTSTWQKDDNSHWVTCTKCSDIKLNVLDHTWIQENDDTHHWKQCSICGYETTKVKHDGNPCKECKYESSHKWVDQHNETKHWQECSICHKKQNEEKHTAKTGWINDSTNHWQVCSKCSDVKLNVTKHSFVEKHDSTFHWKQCSVCGYTTTKVKHDGNPCKECGYKSNVEVKDNTSVKYQTHVQTYGWQNAVYNGDTSGTTGKSKRLEAITLSLQNTRYSGSIQYRTHIQTYGWENGWKENGQMSGTSGKAKRLEAIQIRLTGEVANKYDVYYRVHAQHFGWLDWAKNGESAGTATYSYRLEAIEVKLVEKGQSAPGSTTTPFHQRYISYQTHVQTYGWQSGKYDGEISGTTGQAKRLEGIKISLPSQPYSGSIQYRTHIQTYGWENGWKANGEMSGTSGQSKRLEAIQIQLTGEMANHYDIYYRVHAQKFGWLGWTKNGESAGTAGYAYRLEGIQIVLVSKGGKAPGSTSSSFYSR